MNNPQGGEIESREHYPYVTRSLLRLYGEGVLTNVVDVVVEPEYGYVTRITYTDGNHRITYGNDLGLNTGAAGDLAKDKGHTKFMLKAIGVNCPEGEEFLLPWWADKIRATQQQRGNNAIKTADMAEAYVEEKLGYPVYVKPVHGSKGSDIYKVSDANELNNTLDVYDEKKISVAIVEEQLLMPDYRVVMLDGELISAYRRDPLAVIGDGKSTLRELITTKQHLYDVQGRDTRLDPDDPRIVHYLASRGLTLDTVPGANQDIVLAAISNLSAGGTSKDVTEKINPKWVKLSEYVAKNFNLRLCGVDLACEDITTDTSDYSIIEVNAAPGLDHYASAGETQSRIVDNLYTRVFNALPSK